MMLCSRLQNTLIMLLDNKCFKKKMKKKNMISLNFVKLLTNLNSNNKKKIFSLMSEKVKKIKVKDQLLNLFKIRTVK